MGAMKKKKKKQPESILVGKLLMDRSPEYYKPSEMKKDVYASLVCSKIVESFNLQIVALKYEIFLKIEFIVPVIYDIIDESSEYEFFFGEKYLPGIFEKYNNNAGDT